MTLAEDLRKKYALTSLKLDGNCLALMAINEALEAAAQIADQGNANLFGEILRSAQDHATEFTAGRTCTTNCLRRWPRTLSHRPRKP